MVKYDEINFLRKIPDHRIDLNFKYNKENVVFSRYWFKNTLKPTILHYMYNNSTPFVFFVLSPLITVIVLKILYTKHHESRVQTSFKSSLHTIEYENLLGNRTFPGKNEYHTSLGFMDRYRDWEVKKL